MYVKTILTFNVLGCGIYGIFSHTLDKTTDEI